MDSPIDPVHKSTEYVGLPKVDPWHESEKHKKKRFAKMLDDQMDDNQSRPEEQDEVVVTHEAGQDETTNQQDRDKETGPDQPKPKAQDASDEEAPAAPAHIDLKG